MVNSIIDNRLNSITKHLSDIKNSRFNFYEDCHYKQFLSIFKNFDETIDIDLQYDIDIDKFSVWECILKDFKDEELNKCESAKVINLLKNKELKDCEIFIKDLIDNNNNTLCGKNNRLIRNNFHQYKNNQEIKKYTSLNTKEIIDKMINNIKGIINSPLTFSLDHHFEDRIMKKYKDTGLLQFDGDFEVKSKIHPIKYNAQAIIIHFYDYINFTVHLYNVKNIEDKDKGEKEFDDYDDAFETIKYFNEKYLKGEGNAFDE